MRATRVEGAAEAAAVRHWLGEVSKAAQPFEARWTRSALARVDAELARRLAAQVADFDRALVTGPADDIEAQGAATCRGYAACVRRMEAARAEDDAYMLGHDERTGYTIAIGAQRAAASRVAEIHGRRVVWYSPDEIAALLASVEGLKTLSAIKTIWPGAEVVDVHSDQPAKADSEAA